MHLQNLQAMMQAGIAVAKYLWTATNHGLNLVFAIEALQKGKFVREVALDTAA